MLRDISENIRIEIFCVSKMIMLEDLHDEVLAKVFRNFTPAELNSIVLVCHRFRNIASSEQLWKWYCWRDYKVNEHNLWPGWTYRELYTQVLFKHSSILGFSRRVLPPFGGIVFVKIEKEGLIGYDCLPPYNDYFQHEPVPHSVAQLPAANYSKDALHRLRLYPLFILKPVGPHDVQCYQTLPTTNPNAGEPNAIANLTLSSRCDPMQPAEIRLSDKGVDPPAFSVISQQLGNAPLDWRYWMEWEYGIRTTEDTADVAVIAASMLSHDKVLELHGKHFNHEFTPFTIQRSMPAAVNTGFVKPGLYNGTYAGHGWETIHFRYDCSGTECTFEGIKVAGDPNVPAGEFTVRVHLHKPIFLTGDDQITRSSIEGALSRFEPTADLPAFQPFRIPEDFVCDRPVSEVPTVCRCRYIAEAQVAESGFGNPGVIPCIFSAFSEECFAVIWIDLCSVSLFYRANNADDLADLHA